MEQNEVVEKKEITAESYIQKVVTLTQLKRIATRELTGVFDPSIKMSKVENIFEVENLKTIEEYTKEILDSIMCYMNMLKPIPKLVLDLGDEGVLLIPGKLRMNYEYGRVWTQYIASFDRSLIDAKIVGMQAYAVLVDAEDFVVAKKSICLPALPSNEKVLNVTFML